MYKPTYHRAVNLRELLSRLEVHRTFVIDMGDKESNVEIQDKATPGLLRTAAVASWLVARLPGGKVTGYHCGRSLIIVFILLNT